MAEKVLGVAEEDIICCVEDGRDMVLGQPVLQHGHRGENPGVVQVNGPLLDRGTGACDAGDEIPGDLQQLPIDELCGQRLEVLF